jgi:hypothetical protein
MKATPKNTTIVQLKFTAVMGSATGKNRKIEIKIEYIIENRLMGRPQRPSRQGPYAMCSPRSLFWGVHVSFWRSLGVGKTAGAGKG